MPTDASKSLVELRNLSVRFGRQEVLREISLAVPKGQTVVVIGESGCGKTVLLKSIIGLIRPTLGEVIFDSRNLASLNEKELTRERMRFGFVFQQAALFDSMTVAQNIAFPLKEHSDKSDSEVREKVRSLLSEVGLPPNVVAKRPAELSGGMRKRVGLARALSLSPELMLYDEPTTGLDPIMSDVINELIQSTSKTHPVTSIVVTHDMNTARKVADRVVMLFPLARLNPNDEQVIFDGPPEDLQRTKDRRVTQFVRGEAGERLREMQAAKA